MKTGYCPICEIEFVYFTTRDFIFHAPCKQKVDVVPCELETEDIVEDAEPVQGE